MLGLLLGGPAAQAQTTPPLSGTYYVGTSASPNPSRTFADLPAAMTALGGGVTAGSSVTFTLLDASYPLTATLTVPAPALSAGQGISIVPAAGVSPVISGSVAAGLLLLDGTDNLSINGYDGSTAARTITIRNAAAGAAVLLRNDATGNALRYLTLESANTGASSGTVLFSTSATGGTGNDFNTVANCDVRELSISPNTVPANAIFSLGTGAAVSGVPASTSNSDNTVQDCNIYNFTAGGVFLNDTGNGGNWTISGNNIYQTATRTAGGIRGIRVTYGSGHAIRNNNLYQAAGTTASLFYGIAVANGANGVEISGNTIGGSAPGATGAAMAFTGTAIVYPIFLSVGTTTPCSIQGNTIRNISSASTSVLYGIDLQNGAANIGTVTANVIGGTGSGQGLAAAGPLYGIQLENAATATIQNNIFGGLSTTAGLLTAVYLSGSGAATVSGNTISGLSSNLTTAAQLAGIQSTGTGAVSISNNTLSDISQSGLTSNLYGIQNNFVAGSNVSGNTVTNVTYSGSTTGNTVYGIWAGGSNTISGNIISTVQATGTSKANLRGLYIGGTGATPTVTSNQVTGVLNSTTGTDVQSIGVYVGPTSGAMGAAIVRGNRISNVGTVNTTATASTNVVTGLQLGSLGSGSLIERNRVWNVYGGSAGTGANADQVRGLAVISPNTGTTAAGTFANNQISLTSGTTSQLSYGIVDASGGGTNNYYYNTVYLAPASAAAATSYGFFRSATATPATVELRNNILYNDRLAASGANAFAIGTASTTGWTAASSNYNLFVTPTAAVMGDWAGAALDFAGWKTSSAGDANSYYRLNSALPAATIFAAPASGNLSINPAYYSTPSVIESGGVALSGVTTDYDGDTRQGAAGYSGTGTAPDLGSDEYNAAAPAGMSYDPATGTAVAQVTGPVTAGSTNQAILRVALTTTGAANPISVTQLNFTADGTTALANISNARVYFTGSSPTFSTATQFGTSSAAPAFGPTGFSLTGSQALSEGVNYFFLTYDIVAGATTGNVVDAALTGVKIGTGAVSSISSATGSPAGSRPILGPMSGTYTVGYQLGSETYASLTAAVADLTTRGVAAGQSVTFQLTNPGASKPYDDATSTPAANRETFPIVFPAAALSPGQGLSIVPATGVAPLLAGSNTTGLLVLDGTDNLSINGYDGSTSARTITVRNAGNGPAVTLRNDATGNVLRYLTLESANTSASSGTVFFGTTTGTTGNDDNLISNCDVRELSVAPNTVPVYAIYSQGTGTATNGVPTATANSGNAVQSSNLYNYTGGGVYLNATGSGDAWMVGGPTAALGNQFYQTAARTVTNLINIRLGIGSNHVVSNNQVYQATGAVTGTFYGISLIGNGNGAVIANNTIGGSAAGATGSPLSVNGSFYGLNLVVGTTTPASVQGNVVRNISNTSTSAETHGIRVDSGSGAVNIGTTTGNVIGDPNPTSPAVGLTSTRNLFGISVYSASSTVINGNTIGGLSYVGSSSGIASYGIYSNVDNSAHTITNNTVSGLLASNAAAVNLRGIYVGGNGATPVVNDNQVTSVLNASNGAANTAGIFAGPTSGAFASLEVRGNRVSNVGTTATAALSGANQYVTTGLLVGATAAATVERNRVWNVYGSSAGTGANADQVRGLAVQGASSGSYANNQVSLAAGTATQQTYGIQDASVNGTNNFTYNSVLLPAAPAAAATSYAFFRSATTTPPAGSLRNNLLYNGRPAASGASAFAIGTASTATWTAATSNYNLLISPDANVVGDWGGTALSFAAWKAAQPAGSGGDASSLSVTSTVAPAASLFADVTTGNLDINPANPEAWYANGNGVQVAGQTADYGSAAAGRSVSVMTGGTDIGSDEFTPTSTPPALTVSAAPAPGGTQTFSLGGRTLAVLTYGTAGTVPTSVTGRYYSGANPLNPLVNARYQNSYLRLEPTGGAGFTYDLTLYYDDALLGTVTPEASLRLSRRVPVGGFYEFYPQSVLDATANTLTQTGLGAFGDFTGSDQAAPLPVTLTGFAAFRVGQQALLNWNTATERNSAGYEVQVATDGRAYRALGFVRSALPNSTAPQFYQFTDTEEGKQGLRYYRLKQIDLDGKFAYSSVQTVSFGAAVAAPALTAAPNPFADELTLTLTAASPAPAQLTLTDATGRVVYAQDLPLSAGPTRLTLRQLAQLPAGLYVVQLTAEGRVQRAKVVKR
ncbi:hypothetical protein GCM10028821_00130 [Hymenobacter jeollabukensis]